MIKALIFFLASIGLIESGPDQDPKDNDLDKDTEVRSQTAVSGPNGRPESDSDDDNKHSTKEGL
jgi:hypothetical protein